MKIKFLNKPKFKLIIGNGFDLYCNAKTKYSDFFSYFDNYKEVEEWVNAISHNNVQLYLDNTCDIYEINGGLELEPRVYFWDVFFCLRSNYNKSVIEWCDIEREIYDFFYKYSKNNSYEDQIEKRAVDRIYNLFCWSKYAKSSTFGGNLAFENSYLYEQILCAFIKYRKVKINSENDYYQYLMDDLNSFECKFGQYVYEQTSSKEYLNNALCTIKRICNGLKLVGIDTFNYSTIRKFDKITNHINGDFMFPIFGIASLDDKDNYALRFTKAARKVENPSCKKKIQNDKINNIIIFGHSLNKQDYTYFFSVFENIGLSSIDFNGKVYFLYNVYDEEKTTEIINKHNDAMRQLIKQYGLNKNDNSLFERLVENQKIIAMEFK